MLQYYNSQHYVFAPVGVHHTFLELEGSMFYLWLYNSTRDVGGR